MVLVIVGTALVGLGALVLLKFPDRPGGKVAWYGFEVNSVGAGLPLIVLGVVAIAIAGPIQFSGAKSASPAVTPGAEPGSTGVPAERTVTLEEGTNNRDIIQVDQPKDQPISIKFTQNHGSDSASVLKMRARRLTHRCGAVDRLPRRGPCTCAAVKARLFVL
jgi:hypothetical protein